MKGKKIADIRLFEELTHTKSLPAYIGHIYKVAKDAHLICARFAQKLRERGFMTGDFDHVYIVLTPLLEAQVIQPSNRETEQRIRYYNVGAAIDAFNSQTAKEKEVYLLQLIANVLQQIASTAQQAGLVEDVYQLLLQLGSEMEIIHVTKETSQYKVTISYQIQSLQEKSTAIIEYHDYKEQLTRKAAFLDLNMYEDIYYLVSSITVKNGVIYLKPRTSRTASYHTQAYATPIAIPIHDIPLLEIK
ncbi:hypothetical protein MHB42_07670 [Lysinibacillus sp. FSL K6-0232]|uniref:hypothetical protein n=1 Tax=Lysinibacillus sp. FSL K6-0232 TaxID=2921425 RepID=UPI0030F80970